MDKINNKEIPLNSSESVEIKVESYIISKLLDNFQFSRVDRG